MYLRKLELEEFRTYRRFVLRLDRRGLRLVGPNASGKSSLLEAIAMLATTRSPRGTAEREVINWTSGQELGYPPYARIVGSVAHAADEVEVEIALQIDPERPGVLRKQIKLGGRAVRAMDAVGVLKAVLFSPEDVALVSGPPAGRRRYLDLTISQIDGEYLRALSRFNAVLAQRNSLLKSFARERVSPQAPAAVSQLAFWDAELVAHGAAIVARRHSILARLGELAGDRFGLLTDGARLGLAYRPSFSLAPVVSAGYDAIAAIQSIVAREYEANLAAARGEEVRRGVSIIGPHRDDVTFEMEGMDLATYGSRGQQRLAVIALKLAETALMTERAREPPVLLLDDVLSELDAGHRALMTRAAAEIGAQVIVTATDLDLLDRSDLAGIPLARIAGGEIVSED